MNLQSRLACVPLFFLISYVTQAAAQTNGTWQADADGNFSDSTNWLGGVPGQGGVATFGSANGISNSRTIRVTNATLSGLTFDSPWDYNLTNGTITLSPASIFVLRSEQMYDSGPISTAPNSQLISSVLAGTVSGFQKTGRGMVKLLGTNTFIGNISILDGELAVSTDRGFGNVANSITINGGTLNATALTTSRAINIGTQGGTIRFNDNGTGTFSNGQFNGSLTGNGLLRILGGGNYILSGNGSTFSGPVRLETGTLRLSQAGVLSGTNSFDIAGRMLIDNLTTNVADRISNNATITLRGSELFLNGSGSSEKFGTARLEQGANTLSQSTLTGNGLIFDSLVRQNRSTLFLRGTEGGLPSLAGNFIVANNSPGTLVGGTSTKLTGPLSQIPILPYVHGINLSNSTTGSYFVTWDNATGKLHFLSSPYLLTSLTSTTGLDNVDLSSNTTIAAEGRTINALRIGNLTLTGGPLTINSGAILTSGTIDNTTTINSPISFGNNMEGILHVTSPLVINGVISGTNGLTRGGAATLTLGGNNSYTGQTNLLSGSTFIRSNVLPNSNSPLGNSNTAIVLQSGSIVGNSSTTKLLAPTGLDILIARDIAVIGGGSSTASIGTENNAKLTVNGNISISNPNNSLSNGFLTLEGNPLYTHLVTVNGNISGVGGIRTANGTYIVVQGNNTYSGGTILNGGTVEVGSNSAFGSGTVHTNPNLNATAVTLMASNGSRTIANNLNLNTDISFAGTNPIVWTGKVETIGSTRNLNVQTTGAGVTVQGVLSGTGLLKSGSGTLTLTNSNTYTGKSVVRNGTLVVGGNASYGAGVLGTNPNTAIASSGTVQLGDSGTQATDDIKLLTNGPNQISRAVSVNSFNSAGTTTIGGTNTSGVANFSGSIVLNRPETYLTSESGGFVRYSGVISEVAAGSRINVMGSGITDLNQLNIFTGGVSVSNGILSVNNTAGSATGSGQVLINSNATISGTGTLLPGNNGVIVNGTIAPGNSVGTINFGSSSSPTNLSIAGTYEFELANAGTNTTGINSGASSQQGSHDLINAFGTVSFTGSTINLRSIGNTGFDVNGHYSWLIATTNSGNLLGMPSIGAVTGNDFINATGIFSFGNMNGNLYLNYAITAVPEPSSLIAVSCVGLFSFWRIRQRKKVRTLS